MTDPTKSTQSTHFVLSSGTYTPVSASQHSYQIRAATQADAAAIAKLGSYLFEHNFGYSMPEEDLTAYLRDAYGESTIASEVISPKHKFLVAVASATREDIEPQINAGNIVGFAQATSGTTIACLSELTPNKIELQRLYVHTAYHGTGVARVLVEAIEHISKNEYGHEMIWLGVWEENPKAQRFYGKMGFKKVGAKSFQMGNCIQTDDVFVKYLSK